MNSKQWKNYVLTNTDLCRQDTDISMSSYVNADPNEYDFESARLLALQGRKQIDSILLDLL